MRDDDWDFELIEEYNEIIPNLFLGSHPSDINKFDYVFALNGRPTYYIALGKMVICRPFNDVDCLPMPNEEMLHELADLVLKCITKGPTLVHCAAGINRSSLVLGLALIHQGMKPADAVALIREKRSKMCLSNKTFENWLLNQPEPSEK
jgi:hypothetical protein